MLAAKAAAAGMAVEEMALQQSEGYSTYVVSLSSARRRVGGAAAGWRLLVGVLVVAALPALRA
jgi:hypothetical protein